MKKGEFENIVYDLYKNPNSEKAKNYNAALDDVLKAIENKFVEDNTTDFTKIADIFYKVGDAIKYFNRVSKLPDCNDCKKKNCEYRPIHGHTTRINCPLHSSADIMCEKNVFELY